jgi:N-acetylglutamate synthase-like GNAT family acetyltransferase
MNGISIVDTTMENALEYGLCGYKKPDKPGLSQKLDWLKKRFKEGLIIKTLYSETDGTQGMIEYVPGEYCWRPVDAGDYMFIHCIFVGFKKAYKNNGYGSMLLAECVNDACKGKFKGAAVVVRKGAFMADERLFVKNGFEVVDSAGSDFELMALKFDKKTPDPKFNDCVRKISGKYSKGLFIIRADQCPYTVKNVSEMVEAADTEFGLDVQVIDLKNCKQAQNSPCVFGTFCLIYNGVILAEHPVSRTRFINLMKKVLTK